MIVSINQPAYLPWLGYFSRIAESDVHVVLDHVQFEKNSFTNRNKIRTKDGFLWLTIPILTKNKFGNLAIQSLEIDNKTPWGKKHLESIRMNYAKAPFFRQYFPTLEEIYRREWSSFAEFVKELNIYFLQCLDIQTPIVYSSTMNIHSTKSDLVLDICQELKATTYLSGALGRNYLEEPKFAVSNIKVVYQEYAHPEYQQCFAGFEPYMGIVDILMNHGAASKTIMLTQSQVQPQGAT